MRLLSTILLLLTLLLSCAEESSPLNPDEEDWLAIFNGKDLSGWDIKITGFPLNENYKNTFQVEDSMLRIKYDEYEQFDNRFGHLYYETPYSWYKLRFEYRFLGEQTPGGAVWNVRNSGVMLHSQSAQSVEIDQHFPVSIEIQTLGGLDEGERTTANLCTPGTMVEMYGALTRQHCINSSSKTYHGDQWVTIDAVVYGDSVIHHIMEGDTVLSYQKPQIDSMFVGPNNHWTKAGVKEYKKWVERNGELLSEGYIALQAESHAIDFRKVEVLNLKGCMDKKAVNYKSYYLKADNKTCIYE